MGSILMGLAVSNAIWGLAFVCDPHLVSEEAAKNSKVLKFVKDSTDMVFNGMKLCMACELFAVGAVENGVRKVLSKHKKD